MSGQPEAITREELAAALARRHPDKPRDSAESLARALFADVRCCQPDPLVMPADELAVLRRSCRLLANIVVGNRRAMEAARIELAQGSAEKAMQWILNSQPDVWDDPETKWDGKESANEWWGRTDDFYRAAEADAGVPVAESPSPVPAGPSAAGTGTAGTLAGLDREALGRVVREVWVACAREHPDPKPSWLVPWEELGEWDKETDRRIGEALATHGAAVAAVKMHELHVREIEAAEAKLAAVRAVLLEGGQPDGTARRRALAITGTEEADRG